MSNGQYSVSMGDVLHVACVHMCPYICLVADFLVNATCACMVDKRDEAERLEGLLHNYAAQQPKSYMQHSNQKCQKIALEV